MSCNGKYHLQGHKLVKANDFKNASGDVIEPTVEEIPNKNNITKADFTLNWKGVALILMTALVFTLLNDKK